MTARITTCESCACEVRDGDNGYAYEPAPWHSAVEAQALRGLCWACENRMLTAAEDDRVAACIDAAARAGRFDLI